MNINSFGGASLEEIKIFEQSIGFSLPDDYKQFLIKYNGGTAKVRYSNFNVKDLNEDIPLDVLYGLNIEEKVLDLQYVNDEFIDDIFPNSIIIGDDPGSSMIILINDNDFKGIYYWDYSFYFPQSSEEENTYKIADSFKAFINGLKKP
ncbi:SMI1/KNR4 family protein [Clostridium tarantellae]|uniref:SMI1/KNR4 family protein n=1 Tax=Clostridium tarantellae TaxID=39493 RepID=A0A6I1MPY9_9CLOT|nr:SMI1/KNR4 family protein [Clostridium tarantellae]MPQ44940.1 SMI1/KNR4 family protein [Clostridium tarantellae]